MNNTEVSIIIAAYRASDFIAEAVRSALAQGVAEIEIIVAPDEPETGADYRFLTALDPRVRVLGGVAVPTGPGPARNRALDAARGDFVALLDADDLWSPNYLAELLPPARRHGAAFGRTRLTDWEGRAMREVVGAEGWVTFDTFASAFASLHGVTRRDPARRWRDVPAEDVLFDLESLSLAGGRAPCAENAVYQLRHRAQSMTKGEAFVGGIGPAYDRLIDHVAAGETLIAPMHRKATLSVWRAWREMNARFEISGAGDYQAFVGEFLAASFAPGNATKR